MPLRSGSGQKTISRNIREMMHKYHQTGRIGTSRPRSNRKAVKQAAAAAYRKARGSRR